MRMTSCRFMFAALIAIACGTSAFADVALSAGVRRADDAGRPVRLLVIGNSFSQMLAGSGKNYTLAWNVRQLDHPNGGKRQIDALFLQRSACSLKQAYDGRDTKKWFTVQQSTFDSQDNPFADWAVADHTLADYLTAVDWDIVTIQQYSKDSPDASTYGQNFTNLWNYIREKAPNAEIKFHQTWAYERHCPDANAPSVVGPFDGNVDQRDRMYDMIRANVDALAAENAMDVIPSGYALQLYRYRRPVLTRDDDPASGDCMHIKAQNPHLYLITWTWCRRLFGALPDKSQFTGVSDLDRQYGAAVDAADATDFCAYGRGTVDFRWSVSFCGDDGSPLGGAQSVTNGACATVPNPGTREGYDFLGWSTNLNGTVRHSTAELAAAKTYDACTYYACWGAAEPEQGGTEPEPQPEQGESEPEPQPEQGESEPVSDIGWERTITIDSVPYKVVAFTNVATHAWTVPYGVSELEFLVVGGGGSGAGRFGGGGGAGGVATGCVAVAENTALSITVGGGGAAVVKAKASGNKGGDSVIARGGADLVRAIGGGYGAFTGYAGGNGGSGGGGGYQANKGKAGGSAEASAFADGVQGVSFGNAGGYGAGETKVGCGGGGGGAGGEGVSTIMTEAPGHGGDGIELDITGEPVWYAGGGGGGSKSATEATGGKGGGGNGGSVANKTNGQDGTDGLGGGGGGVNTESYVSGRGGSGVVILRYREPGTVCVHEWGAWTTNVAPTRTTSGERQRTCGPCGKVETEVLPMLRPEVITWTGAGADTLWSTEGNWLDGVIPLETEDMAIVSDALMTLDRDVTVRSRLTAFDTILFANATARFVADEPHAFTLADGGAPYILAETGSTLVFGTNTTAILGGARTLVKGAVVATDGAKVTVDNLDCADNSGQSFAAQGAGSALTLNLKEDTVANVGNVKMSFSAADGATLTANSKAWTFKDAEHDLTFAAINGTLNLDTVVFGDTYAKKASNVRFDLQDDSTATVSKFCSKGAHLTATLAGGSALKVKAASNLGYDLGSAVLDFTGAGSWIDASGVKLTLGKNGEADKVTVRLHPDRTWTESDAKFQAATFVLYEGVTIEVDAAGFAGETLKDRRLLLVKATTSCTTNATTVVVTGAETECRCDLALEGKNLYLVLNTVGGDPVAESIASGKAGEPVALPAGAAVEVAADGRTLTVNCVKYAAKEHYVFCETPQGELVQEIAPEEKSVAGFAFDAEGNVVITPGRNCEDFTYAVEYADDLGFEGSQTTEPQKLEAGQSISAPKSGDRQFYRLRVSD